MNRNRRKELAEVIAVFQQVVINAAAEAAEALQEIAEAEQEAADNCICEEQQEQLEDNANYLDDMQSNLQALAECEGFADFFEAFGYFDSIEEVLEMCEAEEAPARRKAERKAFAAPAADRFAEGFAAGRAEAEALAEEAREAVNAKHAEADKALIEAEAEAFAEAAPALRKLQEACKHIESRFNSDLYGYIMVLEAAAAEQAIIKHVDAEMQEAEQRAKAKQAAKKAAEAEAAEQNIFINFHPLMQQASLHDKPINKGNIIEHGIINAVGSADVSVLVAPAFDCMPLQFWAIMKPADKATKAADIVAKIDGKKYCIYIA